MNRCYEFEFSGRQWTAYCPAAAIYDIYEKYPDAREDIVIGSGFLEPTRDGFDACCWLIAEFCRWGELKRREDGYDPQEILTVSRALLASAEEMPILRDAVKKALRLGLATNVAPEEERGEISMTLRQIEAAERKKPLRGKNGPLSSRRAPRSGIMALMSR